MSIFKESGLSGDRPVTETFLKIGRAVGAHNSTVIIGRDTSAAGQMITSALASGIVSVGANVRDVGMTPTPTLALAASKRGCGIMIAPSESDDECIGLKFWNKDGLMFSDDEISAVASDARNGVALPAYSSVGSITEQSGSIHYHKERVMGALGHADCPVVIDCSSNCPSLIVPGLLTEMGCDVIAINSQPNGRMCGAQKGIDEASVRDLMDLVSRNKGEIGVAVSGDGSRISAVDETGEYIDPGTILALFAKHLEPKKIVLPVNASMMIDDLLNDGTVIRTAARDNAIGEAIMDNDAEFGGSPLGSFIFPGLTYGPDGVYAAALLSKMAGEGRLRDMIDELPKYEIEDDFIRFEGRQADIAKKIEEEVSSLEYKSIVDTDGWRVEMDSGWYLIRFSTTEPVIRITAEARDKMYMNCLMDIAKDVVNDALK